MILLSSVILYQNKKKIEIWHISESEIFKRNKNQKARGKEYKS